MNKGDKTVKSIMNLWKKRLGQHKLTKKEKVLFSTKIPSLKNNNIFVNTTQKKKVIFRIGSEKKVEENKKNIIENALKDIEAEKSINLKDIEAEKSINLKDIEAEKSINLKDIENALKDIEAEKSINLKDIENALKDIEAEKSINKPQILINKTQKRKKNNNLFKPESKKIRIMTRAEKTKNTRERKRKEAIEAVKKLLIFGKTRSETKKIKKN